MTTHAKKKVKAHAIIKNINKTKHYSTAEEIQKV